MDKTAKPNCSKSAPYRIYIDREFIGDSDVTEVMLPIIADDIRRRLQSGRTFDTEAQSA